MHMMRPRELPQTCSHANTAWMTGSHDQDRCQSKSVQESGAQLCISNVAISSTMRGCPSASRSVPVLPRREPVLPKSLAVASQRPRVGDCGSPHCLGDVRIPPALLGEGGAPPRGALDWGWGGPDARTRGGDADLQALMLILDLANLGHRSSMHGHCHRPVTLVEDVMPGCFQAEQVACCGTFTNHN